MRPRLILDDGTPNCLPSWARDELVRRRLEWNDIQSEISDLRVRLAVAQGTSEYDARMEEFSRNVAEAQVHMDALRARR